MWSKAIKDNSHRSLGTRTLPSPFAIVSQALGAHPCPRIRITSMYTGPSQNKSILLSLKDIHRKKTRRAALRSGKRGDAESLQAVLLVRFMKPLFLLVFGARVPHRTRFTHSPLTDSGKNLSRRAGITKGGSITRCQSLPFH